MMDINICRICHGFIKLLASIDNRIISDQLNLKYRPATSRHELHCPYCTNPRSNKSNNKNLHDSTIQAVAIRQRCLRECQVLTSKDTKVTLTLGKYNKYIVV